jgi:hypothetical protein
MAMTKAVPNRKIIASLAIILALALCFVMVFQLMQGFLYPNQPSTVLTSPSTPEPPRFVVRTVTASPSNSTPGLVNVTAEIQNNGDQKETVLVEMLIQEPNGETMSIPNSTSTLEISAHTFKEVTFQPMIPLNVKIGKFNVDIDIYDLNQTSKLASTGFIYPFTTPIRFHFFLEYPHSMPNFSITVDGETYYDDWGSFYWYLGTNHTIQVPELVMNGPYVGWKFSQWGELRRENPLQLTVAANTSTMIPIIYDPYFS